MAVMKAMNDRKERDRIMPLILSAQPNLRKSRPQRQLLTRRQSAGGALLIVQPADDEGMSFAFNTLAAAQAAARAQPPTRRSSRGRDIGHTRGLTASLFL